MLGPFSRNGRYARPMPTGIGKAFYVVPASSALLNDLEKLYPTDEDGVKRVYSGNTGIDDAIGFCTAAQVDKIYVYPGAYTISTAIAVDVNDISIIGLGAPGAVKLTGSAANIMTITADNVEIAGLELNIVTTKKAIVMTGADNCNIHDNIFKASVGGAASHFIHMLTTACNDNWIHDNKFLMNLDVSSAAVIMTSHITGLGIGNVIEHNFFLAGRLTTDNNGEVTNGIVFAAATDQGNLVRHNSFSESNGGFFAAALNYGTSVLQGGVFQVENNFLLATATNAVINGTNSLGFGANTVNGTL